MSAWLAGTADAGRGGCSPVVGPILVVADAVGQVDGGIADADTAIFLTTMTLGIGAGLWIWGWRPATHMGPLMTWWPVLWVAQDLLFAFPQSGFVSTVGLAIFGMSQIVLAQVALSYPNGRMIGRVAWVYIYLGGYLAQVIQNVYNLLFWDARGIPGVSPQEPSWLHISLTPPIALDQWNKAWALRDHRRRCPSASTPSGTASSAPPSARDARWGRWSSRRQLLTITSWIQLIAIVRGKQAPLSNLSYVEDVGLVAFVLTSFLGLALTRRARGAVGDLIVELERSGPGGVRGALARAIGDPTLELALWLPDRGIWVDEQGREVELPDRTGPRGDLRRRPPGGDRPRPGVLRPAGDARGGGLGRAVRSRERAACRPSCARSSPSCASLERASSARPTTSAAGSSATSTTAPSSACSGSGWRSSCSGRARATTSGRASSSTRPRSRCRPRCTSCASSRAASTRPCSPTTASPRPCARWRSARPSPSTSRPPTSGFPGEVETAVYFVVAEALANVAKHAHATKASVQVARENGAVRVEVQRRRRRRRRPRRRQRAARARRPRGRARRSPAASRAGPAAAPPSSWRSRARRDRRRHRAPPAGARPAARGCRRRGLRRGGRRRRACSSSSRRRSPMLRSSTSGCRRPISDEGLVAAARIRELHPRGGRARPLSVRRDELRPQARSTARRGGCGYLLKDRVLDAAQLVDALERVAAGETVSTRSSWHSFWLGSASATRSRS